MALEGEGINLAAQKENGLEPHALFFHGHVTCDVITE